MVALEQHLQLLELQLCMRVVEVEARCKLRQTEQELAV
jgi:hypothetical protein